MKYEGQSSPSVLARTELLAKARSEKERMSYDTVMRFLEAVHHVHDLDELAEVTAAVDRLHHRYEAEIAQRHREDDASFERRHTHHKN